jgi:hypothetical protein
MRQAGGSLAQACRLLRQTIAEGNGLFVIAAALHAPLLLSVIGRAGAQAGDLITDGCHVPGGDERDNV